MTFDTSSIRNTRKMQIQSRLTEMETLTPFQLRSLRIKREAGSQRLSQFYRKVKVRKNGCWAWTGTCKPDKQGGYPMMSKGQGDDCRTHSVHAVAWAYKHIRGLEAPVRDSGTELSHTCEGKGLGSRCTNPWHVVEESHKKNMGRLSARLAKRRNKKS